MGASPAAFPAAPPAAPPAAFAASQEQAVSLRDWVAVIGGVLGAFMAVLDIQITNASLADIQGSLGASIDEGSWISTGYLIAEIITIPMTGWLAMVFGLRRYLLVNCMLFLVFSMLCGAATDLNQMILFRIGQGFTGGVLIPLAFTIILMKLPASKRAIGTALFGFSATFAPAIGPTIGGWLTDNYSWHWIFYINIVPGAALIAMIWYGLDNAPMRLEKLRTGDYGGILCMAIGLGSLEYMLEEGQRKDWFGDPVIRACGWVAPIFLALFLYIELTRREPFLQLRLLAKRTFGVATLINFATGLALYGSVYLLPVYLSQVQRYNALEIGKVQMWMGLPQPFLFMIVPFLARKFDSRWICGFGISLFAASCFINASTMTHETGIEQLRVSQLVRAAGQPFLMGPLSGMAVQGIPPQMAGQASALFNMMRNLGGSVGIALLSTNVEHREHYHFSVLAERLTRNGTLLADRLATMGEAMGGPGRAVAQLARTVRREATTMAYADSFALIGMGLVVALAGVAFLARLPRAAAGGEAH